MFHCKKADYQIFLAHEQFWLIVLRRDKDKNTFLPPKSVIHPMGKLFSPVLWYTVARDFLICPLRNWNNNLNLPLQMHCSQGAAIQPPEPFIHSRTRHWSFLNYLTCESPSRIYKICIEKVLKELHPLPDYIPSYCFILVIDHQTISLSSWGCSRVCGGFDQPEYMHFLDLEKDFNHIPRMSSGESFRRMGY